MAEGGGDEKTSGGMAAVFISYASQDAAVANAVVAALENGGIKCWVAPRDVIPGEFYAGAIVHAIDATKAIVLVLSANAAGSQHISREVERASSRGHPVVSFRIDLAPMPADLEYFLNTSHWLDASATGVERALPKLVDAVQRAVASTPSGDSTFTGGAAASAASAAARPSAVASVPRPSRTVIALLAVIALGLTWVVADKVWLSKYAPDKKPVGAAVSATPVSAPAISEKSVAVLPFVDMSEKKDQEYFSDGIAEDILNLLAKVPGLQVPARTSSFYFKGKSEDIPTIARRLMVAHVLEGSVRKSGNRVRVTIQLIRADNGYHIWSETYNRTLDDIFKVQDEIAIEVVKALKISLSGGGVVPTAAASSPQVHALLLQARFLVNRGGANELTQAVGYYHQALQLDPTSAPAWAGLSRALVNSAAADGRLQTPQLLQTARQPAFQAAERAIAADPKLADGYFSRGHVRYQFDWDWQAAEADYKKGRALDPTSERGLLGAGNLAAVRGDLSGALGLWEQAATRDPLNSGAQGSLAYAYYALGRLTDAEASARRVVELSPTWQGVHVSLAQMLLAQGKQDAAFKEIEKESGADDRAYALARAYAVLGRKAESRAALADVEKNFAATQPYNIASVHALLGEPDQAFLWLGRSYQQHDPALLGIPPFPVDPDMRSLRGDPRYKAFLRKMKLPE
jgi:TolB-like protein